MTVKKEASKMIRGISCALKSNNIISVLSFLLENDFVFYVPWCLKIDSLHPHMPGSYADFYINSNTLKKWRRDCVWEILVQAYPQEMDHELLISYEDFSISQCQIYLIYYDCGLLDVYIKESELRTQLWQELICIGVEDLAWITDENDGRTKLTIW